MNKNASGKGLNAEEFFNRSRIRSVEALGNNSAFSQELKQKLSSGHLFINGEYAPASMKEKILILFKSKPAILLLCSFFGLFALFTAVMLFVPSFRDSVSSTAAKFLGREKHEQEQENPDLETEEDTHNPDLVVKTPGDGTETTDEKVVVSGETEKDTKKVTINGVSVDVNDGKFSKELELALGPNKIRVVATGFNGKESEKELLITRKEKTEEPTPTPKPTEKSKESSLGLRGTTADNGIKLDWSVSNLDTGKGFKIVWSQDNPNPVYPGNDYAFVENGSARNYTVAKKDGKKYYFRVCQYLGDGKCGKYSNSIQIMAPSIPAFSVTGLTLTNGDGYHVSWTVTGNPANGYKLLWSKTNSTPTYGGEGVTAVFFGSDATSGNIGDGGGEGTYYVRLCAKNNDGGCFYSNVVIKTLP